MNEFLNKKALIIYTGFIGNGGGVVTHAKHLSNILAEMGIENKIFSMECIPGPLKYIFPLIERLLNLIFPPIGFEVRMRLTKLYFDVFLRDNYDYYFFEDIYTVPRKFLNKSLIFIHSLKRDNLQNFRKISKIALNRLYELDINMIKRQKDRIYVVSDEYKNKVEKYYNISNLKVFNNFISYDYDNYIDWGNKDNYILFVGNLENRKNPIFVINVMEELKKMDINFKLYIIGREKEITKKMLNKIVYQKHLEENVEVLGKLDNKDVLNIMRKSKAFVLPSLWESFGFVFLEAKLNGCIVVSNINLDVPKDLVDYEIELDEKKWSKTLYQILSASNDIIKKSNLDKYKKDYAINFLVTQLKKLS
ncbi:glycosyltransferase family 4 protein [Thermoanaerobacterium thermosaccharolyticum]|uniref:glycosyltransferase family 4 protein n=1 Tax=Thermoanaerobacterium thermosaccharolyticum TaxID=1517 RepID=UPI003DA84184